MPTVKLKLNTKSIDAAIRAVEKYRRKVDDAGERMVREMVDYGVKKAKEAAMYMDAYDSGELVNGIVGEQVETLGSVVSTAPHSAFVEFGTGVRGMGSQHPDPNLANWKYDVNEHGEAGWWYWGDDGRWHWTAGMPSRPYMYDTAKAMKESVVQIAKDVMK